MQSGDHSLAKINRDYPVFVLSFCIFSKADYMETVCPLLQRFKMRWWPHDGFVLHSARIKRQQSPFTFLKSCDKREQFMADLTQTLSNCPFTLIAGVIDKMRLRMPGFSIEFFRKAANLPGLQIADLVSAPVGRHVIRPHGQNRAFEMIQQKFARAPNGELTGHGFQVFP